MTSPLALALQRGCLVRAMAAHSPLAACLAAEAGFDAVWASGFELSALYGVADMSLLSMTQHLDMVRAITDRIALPVIVDVDTGYGNAINVRRTVRQYERAAAAAIVIEDKTFPKVTSLREGARQALVPVAEFQGKIEAATDARTTRDLLIVARTEALIAGLGMTEALDRASAYAAAGADLVLVHSKQRTPDEIETFVRAWDRPQKLVIVPTAFPQLTEAQVAEWTKVAVVIYGNHAIRACVHAMRAAFATIARHGSALAAEGMLAPVSELFALQEMERIARDERRFLR